MGEKSPLRVGPSWVAAVVRMRTTLVATIMRNGTSHAGGLTPGVPGDALGRPGRATRRVGHTRAKAPAREKLIRLKRASPATKATRVAAVLPIHPVCLAARPYTRQEKPMAARPSSVPTAAPAAKAGPCSKARNTEKGGEVRGKAASHPHPPGPHQRCHTGVMAIARGASMGVRQNDDE